MHVRSLRSNPVSKLAVVFKQDLGMIPDWNEALRMGDPVQSSSIPQYIEFSTGEQTQAGVVAKQAPALLHTHLLKISELLCRRVEYTADRPVHARHFSETRGWLFITVCFRTKTRHDQLTHTRIHRSMQSIAEP